MRLLAGCLVVWLAQAAAQPSAVADLDGRTVDALRADPGVRATALIFLRTDCPISGQAAPEIQRIHADNRDRGVRVWLVFVDPRESGDTIRDHLRSFGLDAPALRDHGQALAARAGVRVTPEAALYMHDTEAPRLVYRGRLDNRVARLGVQRPRATRRDLQEAIDKALAGAIETPIVTPAVGCAIAGVA